MQKININAKTIGKVINAETANYHEIGSTNELNESSGLQEFLDFLKFKDKLGLEMAKELSRISELVLNQHNGDASQKMIEFHRELSEPKPNKSKLSKLWLGIEKLVPVVNSTLDIVDKVMKLF